MKSRQRPMKDQKNFLFLAINLEIRFCQTRVFKSKTESQEKQQHGSLSTRKFYLKKLQRKRLQNRENYKRQKTRRLLLKRKTLLHQVNTSKNMKPKTILLSMKMVSQLMDLFLNLEKMESKQKPKF
jgi:hypothetical protein